MLFVNFTKLLTICKNMSPASGYFENDMVKEGYAITADGYIEVATRS